MIQLFALIIWVALVIGLAVPVFMLLAFLASKENDRPLKDEPPWLDKREM